MKFLRINTAATDYPVTVAEVKASARIDADDEDALFAAYIAAATRSVEEMVGRALMPQTWDFSFHGKTGRDCVTLPVAPVSAVDAITYQDIDDVQQTLNVSDFYLFGDDDKSMVQPKENTDWPNTFDRPDAITFTIAAGYPNASSVPETLRHAVTLLATHWFEHRMPVHDKKMMSIPLSVDHLIGLDRRGWFAA